jgi:FkbM family methyltransferase
MDKIIDYLTTNNVKSVLDIGANLGTYSLYLKNKLPHLYIFMLEANLFCAPVLQRTDIPYDIACLSDTEKQVKLYLNRKNVACTGTSYYKENTEHYKEGDYINVNTRTLDGVIMSKYGQYKEFDFVKMDTQGSELDIIRGGLNFFSKVKHIQMEISLMEYNTGAPLKDEVFDFMNNLGYKPQIMVDQHYWNQNPENDVIQEDWIFSK